MRLVIPVMLCLATFGIANPFDIRLTEGEELRITDDVHGEVRITDDVHVVRSIVLVDHPFAGLFAKLTH